MLLQMFEVIGEIGAVHAGIGRQIFDSRSCCGNRHKDLKMRGRKIEYPAPRQFMLQEIFIAPLGPVGFLGEFKEV